MTTLKRSRYNLLVPLLDGRAVAHNTMSGATAVLEPHELATLQKSGESTSNREANNINNLVYGGFVVPSEFDEFSAVRQEFTRQRMDASGMTLTITPTLSCNFGCDYCFQGSRKPAGRMSVEVQEAILAFVERYAPNLKRLHVAWYGGEPLLAQAIVESLSDRLITFCDARHLAYSAMIVTNGYQLTSAIARSLHRRKVIFAQVTLDGPAEYHDCRRTTLGGGNTFDRIINNLWDVVEDSALRVDIRINVDSRNAGDISELLDTLAGRGFAGRKTFSVYFAPVEAITQGCHSVSGSCMTKVEYSELETSLYRRAYDLGLASLPYPRRFRGLCSALRPRGFVITPTGDIHKCWDTVSMPHLRVGTIFCPELLEDDLRVERWTKWDPFVNAVCRQCKLLPSCTGSCAHKFVNSDQACGEAASLPCPSWKYQIKERLVMFAVKTQMIRAEDYCERDVATDPLEICPYLDPVAQSRGTSKLPLDSGSELQVRN
jgi:uncharacterized protein